MVQLKCFAVVICLLSQSAAVDLVNEESKNIVLKSKKSHKLGPNNHFHCDLSLLPQQKKMMYYGLREQQTERSFDIYKWPKNKEGLVIVPYWISRNSQYTSDQVRLIRVAMDAVEAVTCIRFKKRKHETDYVSIHSGQFCKSNLGRTGGAQELSLNNRLCFQEGIIIHELLHALGYIHMHSSPDRDKHVKILWQNIVQQFYSEFNKVDPGMYNTYGTPYDYQSIMHYGPTAFSKNGARTIIPKDSRFADTIGQRNSLSDGDIKRINNKYKCYVGESNLFSSLKYAKEKPSYKIYSNHDEHLANYGVFEDEYIDLL